MSFRKSKYIDFDTGDVTLAPMVLKKRLKRKKVWTLADKIRMFECRVDVWHLGVGVAVLREIDAAKNPSIWSHAAYGLVSVVFNYFEMIGKTVNPLSATSQTAGDDFNYGFCDVYPEFKPTSGICSALIPTAGRLRKHWPPNPHISDVKEFRDRIRNGIYHLGYTKNGVWLHNSKTRKKDFEIRKMADRKRPGQKITTYWINPHRITATLVDHFSGFVARLRDPANTTLQAKFVDFFDNYHNA